MLGCSRGTFISGIHHQGTGNGSRSLNVIGGLDLDMNRVMVRTGLNLQASPIISREVELDIKLHSLAISQSLIQRWDTFC